MSHTPGPWEINRYSNYEGYSISAEKRGCLAERWYPTELDEQENNEMAANARLIAAAPLLLKNLEIAIHRIETGDKWTEDLRAVVAEATEAPVAG